MKKLLLFIGFLALSVQGVDAQSLENTSVPASATIGGNADFTLSYVSAVPCKVEATLFLFDVDGQGVFTPDWSTWKAGIITDILPAVAEPTAQTLTLAIPGNLDPSSALPAGKTYVWVLNLKDQSDAWLAGSQIAATLLVSGEVTNAVSFTTTAPATANVGATVTVNYSYSLLETGIVKIALSKYVNGSWNSDVATVIVDPAAATTAIEEGSADLVIPADTPLTADLAEGEEYKWELSLFTPGWASYLTGAKSDVELTDMAGLAGNRGNAIAVYPNPANSSLTIKGIDVVKTEITDVTGKTVLTSGALNTVNVASLAQGIYFVRINDARALKFIKN